MDRLKGKVALVTGGSGGIGRAICELFAKEGAKVAVIARNEKNSAETVKLITDAGGEAKFWQTDISNEDSVKKSIDAIVSTWGKLDVLVNNAGMTGVDKATHEVSLAEWEEVFNADVKGVFLCTKHAVPHMLKNGRGSIVNIGSIYGVLGAPELTPYHAAKGAVRAMSRQDAIMYAKNNIRVNCIHPGTIMTPLVKELGARTMEGGLPAYEKMMAEKHPIGHAGEPNDIAYGVLYLASDEAKFVTGTELFIDGGYSAW